MAYTRLKYIESNGTQWIDTGFNPDGNTRVVLDFKLVGETPNRGLFGARGATPSFANRFCFWYLDGVFRTDYGTNNKSFPSGIDIFERHTVDKNKSETTLDGNYSLTNTTTTYSSDYSLYIFACNEGGNSKLPTPMRLYSCQIYDNDVLVRDYVPMANAQGVCGLWDKVNDTFYTSPNGNNFVGHIEGQELPIGYTKCEYIESDGTNFIDTGFNPNQDTRIVIDFKGLQWGTNEVCMWMGVSSSPYFMFGKASSSNYRAYFYYKTSEVLFSESTADEWETRQTLDWNKNVVTWGGVSKSISSSTFQCADNAYLFAANNGGEAKFITRGRIYSCQIYDNGILVRDYVPCQDMYGVYGLYDLTNNVFYQSETEYGFTGKWAEDKKLLISPSEFRKRLMMLAVTDKKPDYSKLRGVFIEDIDGGLYTQNEWDGSKIPNGVAVLADNCRFVVYGYYYQNSLFDYQGSILYNASYLDSSYPTFGYNDKTTDYNGKSNTDRICSIEGLDSWSIAVKCRNTVFPNGQNGYLASAGEWNELINNLDEVNIALTKAGMRLLDSYSNMYWLTSTCYITGSAQYAQFWACGMGNKRFETVNMYSEQYSRPLTKLKFDN